MKKLTFAALAFVFWTVSTNADDKSPVQAAAIPAAIFYNLFGTRIKEIGTRMEDFAIEFQNIAERDFGG